MCEVMNTSFNYQLHFRMIAFTLIRMVAVSCMIRIPCGASYRRNPMVEISGRYCVSFDGTARVARVDSCMGGVSADHTFMLTAT